jgi:hypothetical protein
VFLASYQEAKDEKENIPTRASNSAISKAVGAKMQHITAIVLCVSHRLDIVLILL